MTDSSHGVDKLCTKKVDHFDMHVNSSKKRSLPLVKIRIFQNLHTNNANQSTQEGADTSLIYLKFQVCKNRVKNDREIIQTKTGTFWDIGNTKHSTCKKRRLCTAEFLICNVSKGITLCSHNQNLYVFYPIRTIFYQDMRDMCLLLMVYFNLHYIV